MVPRASKRPQDGAKTAPRGPKMAPRWPQDGLGCRRTVETQTYQNLHAVEAPRSFSRFEGASKHQHQSQNRPCGVRRDDRRLLETESPPRNSLTPVEGRGPSPLPEFNDTRDGPGTSETGREGPPPLPLGIPWSQRLLRDSSETLKLLRDYSKAFSETNSHAGSAD